MSRNTRHASNELPVAELQSPHVQHRQLYWAGASAAGSEELLLTVVAVVVLGAQTLLCCLHKNLTVGTRGADRVEILV